MTRVGNGSVQKGRGERTMPDREKVIKGLEATEIMLKQAVDRGGEMAVKGAFKCYNHVSDAIALLKEQEPVEPVKDIARNRRCPKCFTILKGKFCHECGQAVKWE